MNRKKQIVINIILIAFIFVGYFYYFEGLYISKQECIDDYLKSLYKEDINIPVLSFTQNNNEVLLLKNETDTQYFTINIKRSALFYHITHSSTMNSIANVEDIQFSEIWNKDIGTIFFIQRINKNIDTIEIILEDGTTIKQDEWYEDICRFIVNKNESNVTFRFYDINNQIINEFNTYL